MARIFAYIVHRGGIADDSAFELAAAARKIDPTASPTAILTGWGAGLDAACTTLGASYPEIWKISNEALAYPNAELVRKALEDQKISLESAETSYIPTTYVDLDVESGKKMLKLKDNLDENDDVQNVYANDNIPEEAMAS